MEGGSDCATSARRNRGQTIIALRPGIRTRRIPGDGCNRNADNAQSGRSVIVDGYTCVTRIPDNYVTNMRYPRRLQHNIPTGQNPRAIEADCLGAAGGVVCERERGAAIPGHGRRER